MNSYCRSIQFTRELLFIVRPPIKMPHLSSTPVLPITLRVLEAKIIHFTPHQRYYNGVKEHLTCFVCSFQLFFNSMYFSPFNRLFIYDEKKIASFLFWVIFIVYLWFKLVKLYCFDIWYSSCIYSLCVVWYIFTAFVHDFQQLSILTQLINYAW